MFPLKVDVPCTLCFSHIDQLKNISLQLSIHKEIGSIIANPSN
jgi:hypothetical protein